MTLVSNMVCFISFNRFEKISDTEQFAASSLHNGHISKIKIEQIAPNLNAKKKTAKNTFTVFSVKTPQKWKKTLQIGG